MVTLAGVEPATCGLGNRRSIHLSYRATQNYFTVNRTAAREVSYAVAACLSYAGNRFSSADARRNHGRSRRFK
jgi:hypothetical protein